MATEGRYFSSHSLDNLRLTEDFFSEWIKCLLHLFKDRSAKPSANDNEDTANYRLIDLGRAYLIPEKYQDRTSS